MNKMNQSNQDQLYIMGKNSVFEALQSERSINKIYIAEGIQKSSLHKLLTLAKMKNIITQYSPKKRLDQMTQNGNHQGIVASVAAYDYVELNEIVTNAKSKEKQPFLVLLDEIEDPHNLGSILRSCDVVGVDGVIIPKRRSVGLTTTVSKTSAGAIEHVPVSRVTNMVQTIDWLKDEGFWIVGTDASAEQMYHEIDYKLPIVIVIGSEGKGISRLLKEKCDFMVKLPMMGHVNSLNASVAAGIMLYEVYRNRGF
ncbi:23S rRNA (guanosine(2251)-2'-O)-methyltransferase RlmB [Tepidibacillus marianensis]|uniref:23S rRNA (guanosine(2251)-2'-O)-methyltransferase RlmB n=1 Tax=Tepidibacillus marianensis TaxID=3131995 RepID=UPI00386BB053